jgi:hypothetical protein
VVEAKHASGSMPYYNNTCKVSQINDDYTEMSKLLFEETQNNWSLHGGA